MSKGLYEPTGCGLTRHTLLLYHNSGQVTGRRRFIVFCFLSLYIGRKIPRSFHSVTEVTRQRRAGGGVGCAAWCGAVRCGAMRCDAVRCAEALSERPAAAGGSSGGGGGDGGGRTAGMLTLDTACLWEECGAMISEYKIHRSGRKVGSGGGGEGYLTPRTTAAVNRRGI